MTEIRANNYSGTVDWKAYLKAGKASQNDGIDEKNGILGDDAKNLVMSEAVEMIQTVKDVIAGTGKIPTLTEPMPINGTIAEKLEDLMAKLDLQGEELDTQTLEEVKKFVDGLLADIEKYIEEMQNVQNNGTDLDVPEDNPFAFDDTNKPLLSIYTMMAVLLRVLQKLKDASRDIRKSESEAIQTSIKNQVKKMQDSALVGAIIGGIICGLQAIASIASFWKATNNLKTEHNMMNENHLPEMANDIKQLNEANQTNQTRLEQVEARIDTLNQENNVQQAPQEQVAQNQVENLEDVQENPVNQELNQEAVAEEVPEQNANNNLNEQQLEEVPEQNANNNLNEQQLEEVPEQNANNNLNEHIEENHGPDANNNLNEHIEENHGPDANNNLNEHIEENHGQVEPNEVQENPGNQDIPEAANNQNENNPLNEHNEDVHRQEEPPVNEELNQRPAEEVPNQIEEQQNDINNGENNVQGAEEPNNNEVNPEQPAEVNNENVQEEHPQNENVNENENNLNEEQQRRIEHDRLRQKDVGEMSLDELQKEAANLKVDIMRGAGELSGKQGMFRATSEGMQSTDEYRQLQKSKARVELFNQLSSTIGQLGLNVVKGITDYMQAAAQGMTAEQKDKEEKLNMSRDSYQSDQSGIDSVVKLFQEVTSIEHQATLDAIRS